MTEPGTNQRKSRTPFGAFLVAKGVITPGELEAALIIQDERNPKLGRLAHRHQLLSYEKICAILECQKEAGLPFGEAAVKLGYLSDFEVAKLLEEQTANHIHIGELLVELNVMSQAKLNQWLDAYFATVGPPPPPPPPTSAGSNAGVASPEPSSAPPRNGH